MKKRGGRIRRIFNQKGTTLVEVLVAITILLLAAEIISISISFHARMNTKSRQMINAGEKLGRIMQEESLGISGTMEMDINGTKISNDEDARLYSMQIEDSSKNSLRAMWADDSMMTDLFAVSGVKAPELRDKPMRNTLPEEFPDLYMRMAAGKINEVEEYCTSLDDDENGASIIFNNEVSASAPSFSRLEGAIHVSAGGSYRAAGVTVLDTGAISLLADHIGMWLGAEIYYFSGDIECQYSDKYKGKERIPIHLYLEPESGHGQPALVYVEEGVEIIYRCISEDGAEVADPMRENYTIPKGWYAIPAGDGSDTATGAKDLLQLKPEDWNRFCLGGTADMKESGEVDKAYARLILAGLTDSGSERNGSIGQ